MLASLLPNTCSFFCAHSALCPFHLHGLPPTLCSVVKLRPTSLLTSKTNISIGSTASRHLLLQTLSARLHTHIAGTVMMLTVKQSTIYGYKSVHDLPTPPSSSRHSPPLSFVQENLQLLRQLPVASRRSPSPPPPLMSNQHRGLPPPAAMALPPQLTPTNVTPITTHHHSTTQQQSQSHHQPSSQAPQGHPSHHVQSMTSLPTPTSQWQEESLRNWLQARSEEERTKQEEEKTKQENIRLEQRKLEVDMLQHSLRGGIPPPMIPLVFAGMGRDGQLPQSVLEWTQHFMHNPQGQLPQLLPPQPVSPQHQRDQSVQSHVQYQAPAPVASSAPAPGPAPPGYTQHSSSPSRSRPLSTGQSLGGSNIPSLNTSIPLSNQGPGIHMQGQLSQQDASPSIYFHHWHPPAAHSGASSNRLPSPSGSYYPYYKRHCMAQNDQAKTDMHMV